MTSIFLNRDHPDFDDRTFMKIQAFLFPLTYNLSV